MVALQREVLIASGSEVPWRECPKNPTAEVHEYSYAYMGSELGLGLVQVFFCKWCLHREIVDADPANGRTP